MNIFGSWSKGSPQCGPQRHDRDVLVLGVRRDGSRQRTGERGPNVIRLLSDSLILASLIAGQSKRLRSPLYRLV